MSIKKSKESSRDDSSKQIIFSTRTCILTLRPFVTAVPFGSCIQALLDVGIAVLDRIEQIRAWESGKIELCRKINYVFGMIITALNHPYATNAPDLLEDLDRIVKVLQEIDEFVENTKFKGCKLRRFIQSSSDFERVVEFGSKLDEAVKMLTTKSIIQLRLDIQTLKETIEVSAENMKDTFRSSTSTFQSSAERLTEAVRSTAEKLKESYQLSTEKVEKTLEDLRYAISQAIPDISPPSVYDPGRGASGWAGCDTDTIKTVASEPDSYLCETDLVGRPSRKFRGPALDRHSTRDEEPGGKPEATTCQFRCWPKLIVYLSFNSFVSSSISLCINE